MNTQLSYAVPEISISLVRVPNVGRELPLVADFTPEDGVFAGDFLRRLAFCFEGDGADFARRCAA